MPMFVPRSYSSSDLRFKSKPLWLQWQVLVHPNAVLDLLWSSSIPHVAEILLAHCQAKTWANYSVLVPLVPPKQDPTIFSLDTHAFASLTRFWSGVSKNSSSSLNRISKRSKAVKGGQVKCLMLPAVLFCGVHRLSVQTLQDASTQKNMHILWIFIMPCQQNSSIHMILLQQFLSALGIYLGIGYLSGLRVLIIRC